jgi:hypothetical protein
MKRRANLLKPITSKNPKTLTKCGLNSKNGN